MWCDRVLYNLATDTIDGELTAPAGKRLDPIDLRWQECQRVLKKRSRGGRELRVLLPPGQKLQHGDVLFEEDETVLAVNVQPSEVVVVRLSDAQAMARLALELGNLHWPTSIGAHEIIFPADGPPMEVVESLGLKWTQEVRRFQPVPLNALVDVTVAHGFQVVRQPAS